MIDFTSCPGDVAQMVEGLLCMREVTGFDLLHLQFFYFCVLIAVEYDLSNKLGKNCMFFFIGNLKGWVDPCKPRKYQKMKTSQR